MQTDLSGQLSNAPSCGVFKRLQIAAEILRTVDAQLFQFFAVYIRQQVQLIEALQFYIHDMKASVLYRYFNKCDIVTFVSDQSESEYLRPWVVLQLALCILANIDCIFLLPEKTLEYFSGLILTSEAIPTCLKSKIQLIKNDEIKTVSDFKGTVHFAKPFLVNPSSKEVIYSSISPQFSELLVMDTQDVSYLSACYGVHSLMDEFDLLPSAIRAQYVRERSEYLISEIRFSSPYYMQRLSSNDLSQVPVIDGKILSSNVPPYGEEILSKHDRYSIAFASGGTTGRMKFVYRNDWEDKENARYLAKGLYAQGLRSSDIILNCLSGGFWGGSHVFGLAFTFIGCSVIPLGSEFSNSDAVQYIQQLKPTAVIALPSYLATLSEYVKSRLNEVSESLNALPSHTVINIPKCITGGEMLLSTMRDKISSSLGVVHFLSTGYTSNETGAIAFPCSHLPTNHYHIHENMTHVSIAEIECDDGIEESLISDAPLVVDGRSGYIITSNLNRTLMPVIRYKIGDRGRMISFSSDASDSRRCTCGRTLSVMELQGRCDDRARLAGVDLYLDDIEKAITKIPELCLVYSVHIQTSKRHFDELHLHVECNSDTFAALQADDRHSMLMRAQIGMSIGLNCGELIWENWQIPISSLINADGGYSSAFSEDEIKLYNSAMAERADHAMAFMEGPPLVTFYPPGALPRNKRTGKITRIKDLRK